MKKIICLLSILSLLLCACSPNNSDSSVSNTDSTSNVISSSNDIDSTSNSISSISSSLKDSDTVSKDSESSFVSLVTDDIPTDPGYLPLSYMYAINLDNGGKVTPGMTREEVEKVFPQPKNGNVEIEDLSCDSVISYNYGGILFCYTYEEVLESIIIDEDRIGSDKEKKSWFNCEVAGFKISDLNNKKEKDIIEKFGESTYRDSYVGDLYVCHIEDDRLKVLTYDEYKMVEDINEEFIHIRLDCIDNKISTVDIYKYELRYR